MTMRVTTPVEIRHFHLFCGLGGGARGFNRASPRVGNLQAKFRCLGGIDVDPASIRDFGRLAGVPGTVLDLFDREQYRTFHGAEPPADWREATAADIQRAAGGERPNIVFLSAPCKGFSGLLSEGKSKTDKYQALNRLTLRGVWLMLEAWSDDPPELVIFENVPRIATRGRHLLDQIVALLRAYGYAVAETTHDCGEIGGLAQSRRRFLLVARHAEKVPSFLYQPHSKPLRAVGDVLGRMLLPGDLRAGPMHRVPSLQWKTWVRLAFVEAGSDWRSLNRLAVEDGTLRDYLIVPALRGGAYGVQGWGESMGTVAGESLPSNGAFSVADPRHHGPAKHSNEYRVVRWDRAAMAVTSAHGTGQAVADPRRDGPSFGKYAVTPYGTHAGTVISGSTTGQGAFAVADPRSGMDAERTAYTTGGHYGVVPWDSQAGAVSGAACHDNGRWSVADPRMPAAADKLVCRIVSEDGTWHRPFTTLELAHLQSLVEPDELLELDGTSDQAKRERIGNAVPSEAGEAIAHVMGETLLLALSGETFILSAQPVWVRPIALGLAMGTTA
ncbi:DNA cytosine methyltransferase [Delftia sp. NA_296.1]|uniref:DNA cytosine methyltransferase n=1 Tax=Delftia sp. NA_296.1 TaxID=3415648 RepID=UPI0040466F31